MRKPSRALAQEFLGGRVNVVVGDITEQRVDAVVNAANESLMGGAGVDGALHRLGGPQILEECRALRRTRFPRGLPTGEAVITTGGLLPARYIIHTVGPVWSHHEAQRAAELLTCCYRTSLALAVERELGTLAFPAISTGAYGYPRAEAARIASQTIADFFRDNTSVQEVRLVFFSPSDRDAFVNNEQFTSSSTVG